MKRINSRIHTTRLHLIWGLALLIVACGETPKEKVADKKPADNSKVIIHWEDRKATSLVIPQKELRGFSNDSLSQWLNVQLAHSTTDILGEYDTRNDSVVFTPLIPFTRGFEYTVKWKGSYFQQIRIPEDSTLEQPEVLHIFPSGDSIPANVLKMYIVFSKPMAEGQAIDNIEVFKNKKLMAQGTFLDLDQELWNKDRTMLTVWFDPGRIKRDLQPNKRMGPPIEPGNRYVVAINQGWEDTDGLLMRASSYMDFIAVKRDEESPDPAKWTIIPPIARSQDPLVIYLHEALDFGVLKDAVRVLDFKGQPVNAKLSIKRNETVLHFTPARPWTSGYYSLEIEPRLEDLAGNNLERLFDKDLLKDTADKKKITTKIVFAIR